MIHELKTLNPFFTAVILQKKNFELRKNDRGFKEGDTLILKEYSVEEGYSGREAKTTITYILKDFAPALHKDYVVLGMSTITPTK